MREGTSIAATKASAVSWPTPGIVMSRRQATRGLRPAALGHERLEVAPPVDLPHDRLAVDEGHVHNRPRTASAMVGIDR
jgi:hypothetical protein